MAIALFLVAPSLHAQERPGDVYAGAGITSAAQSGVSGTESQTYVAAAGGRSTGWLVTGGVFVMPSVSIDAEASGTGRMEAVEPSRYGMVFNERLREQLFIAGVRFHVPAGRTIHVEPVVGAGLVTFDATRRTDYYRFDQIGGPPNSSFSEDLDVRPRVAILGGADVRFGGARVAVVPGFRFLYWGGNDPSSRFPGGEIASWAVRMAVAARVDF